jgi:signal transduction histidine kinase/ActR/RegA family two-component response regulator
LPNLTAPPAAGSAAGQANERISGYGTNAMTSALLRRLRAMWPRLRAWLDDVPIDDPIDRRNAPFMQLFLIYIGCKTLPYKVHLLLFNSAYQILLPGHEWPGAPPFPLAFDLGTDVLMTASAWAGLYLIRKGAFRLAVSQFLCAMTLATLIAYAAFGYLIWRADMVAFEVFALAGFMRGRKALWLVYAAFIVVYAAGMTTDYFRQPHVMHSMSAYNALPSLILAYFVVTVILDRTSTTLRRTLAESNRQRQQLQVEMARREQAQEQLLHAQKMEAVGKLASGIAHDFNNVLGIIQGFAMERRRLDAPGASPSEDALALGRALQGIETAARRGASISRKLLKFSRNDVTRAETFDAAKSLRDLQPLLRQMLPPGARLGIEAPDAPLWVEFDRSQFELALLNRASNACDAKPRGGELAMSIAAVGTDQVLITVSDDGEGMPDEVRQRIFEPFYTTKPADAGTGLGLTVVYALVDRFGGRIEVDSAPGRGTTFRILLPVAAAPGEGAHASTGGPNQPVRVMLVEDDDDLLGLLKSALERGGCDVQATASGREAARLVGEDDFRPQVLVCDSGLRDMDGTTLLASLRTQLPDAPIILISASLDSDAAPADADPRTERLPKPFPPDELVTRVWQAARRHAAAPLSRAPGRTPRHAPH